MTDSLGNAIVINKEVLRPQVADHYTLFVAHDGIDGDKTHIDFQAVVFLDRSLNLSPRIRIGRDLGETLRKCRYPKPRQAGREGDQHEQPHGGAKYSHHYFSKSGAS